MTEQQPPPPQTNPVEPAAVINATADKAQQTASTQPKAGEDPTTVSLTEIQENAGQISELAKEEDNLVTEFFSFMFKILKPFSKTLEISVSALPEQYRGQVSKSYLYLTGQLVLVHTDGELEILNLADKENHDILVQITEEIMAKLKTVINTSKLKTENRVKFLITVTKELQKVAKIFSE